MAGKTLVILGLVSCLALPVLSNVVKSSEEFPFGLHPDGQNNDVCGGFLNDSVGIIWYKPTTPVLANERCVWFLRAPNAAAYDLDIAVLGFPSDDSAQKVVVTTIEYKDRNGGVDTLNFTNVIPSSTGRISAEAQTVMITFFSGSTTGPTHNGFALTYGVRYNDESASIPVVAGTIREILPTTSPISYIRHPEEGNYSNYEQSLILWKPENNIKTDSWRTHLTYFEHGLQEKSCKDLLFIYKLNVTSSSKWVYETGICSIEAATLSPWSDLMLVIFHTDGENVNSGFYFAYI